MVFPDRLTLPTRPIIPTSNNPSCMVCHRVIREEMEPVADDLEGRIQLSTEGSNHTGRFSPDGRYIAFVSERSGSEQIWLMNRPTYHPRENLIAYSAQTESNWDIWLTTEDGNLQYRVTTAPDMESNPLWSPDGLSLLFEARRGGSSQLLISDNTGSNPVGDAK